MASRNSILFSEVKKRCENLALSASNGTFPVRLAPLMADRGVVDVWFQPMIADGVLAKDKRGFLIGVHTQSAEIRELCETRVREKEQGALLPERQRFTIAHELAHTFFYELSSEDVSETLRFVGGGGKTADEHLEHACDQLAAALLLPEALLESRITDKFLQDPDQVRELAHSAGVSLVTLLIRFESLSVYSSSFHPSALILQRYQRGRWVLVRGLYGMGFSVSRVRNLVQGDSLSLWFNEKDSRLYGGSERAMDVSIETRTGGGVKGRKKCRVVSESSCDVREGAWTLVAVIDLQQDEFE